MSNNEDEEDVDNDEKQDEDEVEENTEETPETTGLEKIPEHNEPEEDEDPSVQKDLAYYVDKIAKTLENKEADPTEGSKFSDSESDEETSDQPDDGDHLRPSQMKSLQNTPKKSSPFHESNLGIFRTVCFAPYKRFVDISSVREFRNLRCVDFGKNYLRDVSALNHLPFLGTIKLYSNGIRVMDSLRSRSVRFLDLSHNKIKDLDRSFTPRLTRLKMNFNRIRTLAIVRHSEIKWLRKLELRGNGLRSTAGIQHPLLEELYLLS
ncbi:leucine-rich repeat-containing protein 23-like isoform X2 [Paramacrobiotus metropolitanus]|uniref:leucine-rich repeat-containing protein 23-like isoform X2 n=1 Tax=Paramacrobiotus metropolitanus TaxID=2943436 RepID=UPI002446047C|nr:leucine-rich repeat-containing protein 23-like isoform X2 [Paramacrobiotus metropolitanus]